MIVVVVSIFLDFSFRFSFFLTKDLHFFIFDAWNFLLRIAYLFLGVIFNNIFASVAIVFRP